RSRYKYGVASKQLKLGNAPEYMEVVCGVELLLWVDSSRETRIPTLEQRAAEAIDKPESVERSGVLCLGLSDDLVDSIQRHSTPTCQSVEWLSADANGPIELPVWVDHVGSASTRWRRFRKEPSALETPPDSAWITILGPEEL